MSNLKEIFDEIMKNNSEKNADNAPDPATGQAYTDHMAEARKNKRSLDVFRNALPDLLSNDQIKTATINVLGQEEFDKEYKSILNLTTYRLALVRLFKTKYAQKYQAYESQGLLKSESDENFIPYIREALGEEEMERVAYLRVLSSWKDSPNEGKLIEEAGKTLSAEQTDNIEKTVKERRDISELPAEEQTTGKFTDKIKELKDKIPSSIKEDPQKFEEVIKALDYADKHLTVVNNAYKNEREAYERNLQKVEKVKTSRQIEENIATHEGGKYSDLTQSVGIGDSNSFTRVNPGRENDIKEVYKDGSIAFSEKTADAMRKIFAKFDEMNMLPNGTAIPKNAEDGDKIYAHRVLLNNKNALQDAIIKGDYEKITKAQKEFEKTWNDMEEVYRIARENFSSDSTYIPGNLDGTRNANLSWEFVSDIKTTAQINACFVAYNQCKLSGVGIEEYLKNPAVVAVDSLNKKIEEESLQTLTNGKSFKECLDVIKEAPKHSTNLVNAYAANVYGISRSMQPSYLLETDEKRRVNNSIVSGIVDAQINLKYQHELLKYSLLSKGNLSPEAKKLRSEALQNLLTVSDADRNFDTMVGYPSIKKDGSVEPEFDLNEYIKNGNVDYAGMIERTGVMLDSFGKMKNGGFPSSYEIKAEAYQAYQRVLNLKIEESGLEGYKLLENESKRLYSELTADPDCPQNIKDELNLAKNGNEAGQIYPWEVEGVNFGVFEEMDKFLSYSTSIASIVGKEKEILNMRDVMSDFENENEGLTDEDGNYVEDNLLNQVKQGKIVGGVAIERTFKIMARNYGEDFAQHISDEQKKETEKMHKNAEKIIKEAATSYRNMYKNRNDPDGRYLDEKANEMADWFEDTAKMHDPSAGNYLEAVFHAPYLGSINTTMAGSQRFEEFGFEKCVEVLNQKGVENGTAVYDDFMTILKAGPRETLIQYERQKGEAEGWDGEKEQKYLNDLRNSHAQVTEAFDRLWNVENHNQYDSVLNNEFDQFLGKNPKENRDISDAIGYMKGETRAIDMGYDSRHLHILGQVGLQEQSLVKRTENLRRQIESEKDPEKLENLLKKQAELDTYKKEFAEFKDRIWNTHVQTKEDMEEIEKNVDAFFNDHREKYPDIQSRLDLVKTSLDYNREIEKKSGTMPTPAQITESSNQLGNAATMLAFMYGDVEALKSYAATNGSDKYVNGKYTPENDITAKKLAKDFSKKISEKIKKAEKEAENNPAISDAKAYEKSILQSSKLCTDSFAKGIPLEEKAFMDNGFETFHSIQAHFSPDMFSTENIASTNRAVQELGLHKITEMVTEIQQKHMNFELHKDQMTDAERENALKSINADKKLVLESAMEMQEKLKNPSEEVKKLFVKESQLKDFMGIRGLQGLINGYNRELNSIDIPYLSDLDKSLDRFNTKRSGIFSSESPEHVSLRTETEHIQENLKKLTTGIVENEKGRNLTQEERTALIQDTFLHIDALKNCADTYMAHANPDGKGPHTEAGKERFEGAKEIRNFADKLDKTINKVPEAADIKKEMNKTLKKMEAADEPELRENVKDPLSFVKNRVNGWYEKIKAVDFNMLGKGSDEFAGIVEDMKKLKEFTDYALKADEKGRINTEKLLTLHEKETSVIDKLQNYIDRKEEQIKNDPQRRDDPGKQKREQPRIRTAIGLLVEMKKDTLEQTNMVVENLQKNVRPKVEKMLDAEDKIRSANGISHDDYIKSSYRSLNLINNLDGKKWNIGEKETLRHYCERIQSYADKKTYDKDKQYILGDRSNPGRNVLKEANRLFKENDSKKLTNDDLKEKFSADRQNYEKTPKKFDLAGKNAELDNQAKKLKETLISKQKKEPVKKSTSSKNL